VTLFVDTSTWSLLLRRDTPAETPQTVRLLRAIEAGETILTTGLVFQELLHGFAGPRDRQRIIDRFSALPMLVPDRRDHIDAAALRNACRAKGVQIGTIDALLAYLCIRRGLTMLTSDGDFSRIASHSPLELWA